MSPRGLRCSTGQGKDRRESAAPRSHLSPPGGAREEAPASGAPAASQWLPGPGWGRGHLQTGGRHGNADVHSMPHDELSRAATLKPVWSLNHQHGSDLGLVLHGTASHMLRGQRLHPLPQGPATVAVGRCGPGWHPDCAARCIPADLGSTRCRV